MDLRWNAVNGEAVTYNVYRQIGNGNGTNMSAPVCVTDLSNMDGYIDDRDSRIQYVGSWEDWSESVYLSFNAILRT